MVCTSSQNKMLPWLRGGEKRLSVWDMSWSGWTADNVWLNSCMEAGKQAGWYVRETRGAMSRWYVASRSLRTASSCNMLLGDAPRFPTPSWLCLAAHRHSWKRVRLLGWCAVCTLVWVDLCLFWIIFISFISPCSFTRWTSKPVCVVSTLQKRIWNRERSIFLHDGGWGPNASCYDAFFREFFFSLMRLHHWSLD